MNDIGEHPAATVRVALALPDGRVALGSDYGLTLWGPTGFVPFAWPLGARREARRVEALAVSAGALYVGTAQCLYVQELGEGGPDGEVQSRRHGRDQEDGWDDLLCLLTVGARLCVGWRTRFEGGEGPADALCLAASASAPARLFAGTRQGELHEVDVGLIRRFIPEHSPACPGVKLGTRPPPVRHLAWAEGALWVAAADRLHRYDREQWSEVRLADGRRCPEPTALHTDPLGRLWALAEGRVYQLVGGVLAPFAVSVERPWCLVATADTLWIGGREALWRVALR